MPVFSISYLSSLCKGVVYKFPVRNLHHSIPRCGIKEFYDPEPAGTEAFVAGRAWTVADLRRKVYISIRCNTLLY